MDFGLWVGALARLPPTLRFCSAVYKLISTLLMGYLFLAPVYGVQSRALGNLVVAGEKEAVTVGGTDRAGQEAANGCVGSGKRTYYPT